MVTIEEMPAGFVPNAPVIPAGQFDAASVTAELKPLAGVIVTVDVPFDPAVAVAAVAFKSEARRRRGGSVAQAQKIALATGLPAWAMTLIVTVPLMFHTTYEPLWNPENVRLSSKLPVAGSVIVTVSARVVVSQSSR